jgi:hypothetical protein
MSLVFAAAFFMLWWNQRDRHFIAVMAASFLALSFGFLLQYFTPFNLTLTKLLSNLLLLAGGTGLATGSLARFGCRTPIARTGIFGAAGFIAFLWYLVVDPDITGRVYAINFAVGAISLVIAVEIRSSSRTFRFVDKLLVALTTFFGLSYFVRPVVAVYIEGPYTSYEGFHNSIYWTTMSVSSSMFLLLFSLLLITAICVRSRRPTRFRACSTAAGLRNVQLKCCAAPPAASHRWRSSFATSTTSRRSTTPLGTPPATR